MYKVELLLGRRIGVSGSEEEIYSVMFSSLRHPVRRKILRMLSERKVTYSQILQINQLEGAPNFPLAYTEPQPTAVIQACQGLLNRYRSTFKDSYLDQINTLMASTNVDKNGQILGNSKLQVSSYECYADVHSNVH